MLVQLFFSIFLCLQCCDEPRLAREETGIIWAGGNYAVVVRSALSQ